MRSGHKEEGAKASPVAAMRSEVPEQQRRMEKRCPQRPPRASPAPSEQRGGADEPDFGWAQAQREQVAGKQHGDEAVGESAQRARRDTADHIISSRS